jgi:hypothetical protein
MGANGIKFLRTSTIRVVSLPSKDLWVKTLLSRPALLIRGIGGKSDAAILETGILLFASLPSALYMGRSPLFK